MLYSYKKTSPFRIPNFEWYWDMSHGSEAALFHLRPEPSQFETKWSDMAGKDHQSTNRNVLWYLTHKSQPASGSFPITQSTPLV